MATELTSDSSVDFQWLRLEDIDDVGGVALDPSGDLPVIDLASDEPLPDLPQQTDLGRPLARPHPAEAPGRLGSGSIWLEGDVLMCACPDCHAPMSIRLWLMIADCWRCRTSIELTEEQEREAQRLLRQRERARGPSPSRPAATKPMTTAPVRPAARQTRSTPAAPGERRSKPQASRGTAPAATAGHAPPEQRVRPGGKRVAASQTLARRRAARVQGASAWATSFFKDTPAWLVSLIIHLILLTVLALLTVPGEDEDKTILLNAIVSSEVRRPGQEPIENPADEVHFDLPVPEQIDLNSRRARQAMLRADQEARQLRLVDAADPNLPDLQQVKRRISMPDGTRVALAARDPRVRVEMIRREGGTTLTEAAVARGLRWLAAQQQPDGRWRLDGDMRSDSAATSLALLPFLGAGQTHLIGRYKNEVSQGLRWLVEHQKDNGDLRAGTTSRAGMYAHGQGAIVLCEAYLMTGDEQLRVPAQKAIDFIVDAQYPDGGWRYLPAQECPLRERRSDTSVLGWQLMALQSARAAGLTVPDEVLELAGQYLDSVQHEDGAQYSYQPRQRPTHVMTAEALLCRIYLGWTKDDPALMDGIRYLSDRYMPSASETNVYYWYYATQAFHHVGGGPWNRWNFRMRDILVNSQEKAGWDAGSWSPRGGHASAGGRLYMTALAVCTLEVYYRHLPIFRQIDVE